jgi:hypothetical protein
MEIVKETDSYNERRYGRPWIARVDYTTNRKGEFTFGDWAGKVGGIGELFIQADVHDIVAVGQKDHRKSRNSSPTYFIVSPSGELEYIGDSPITARKLQEGRRK